ncbi:hypothetical protein LLEC1_03218 [Akanthomyces lecanii]|uniref:SH3 domain-containing protein n=1 Tax=Cordyceps confragosa TaxID=2714763 RepID=A0A179I5G0_CORDF|nr:hypothetical protein LLEC1_03218 [Akanthomyces lecanii]
MGHAHLHQQQHQKRDFWDNVGSLVDELPKSEFGDKIQRGEPLAASPATTSLVAWPLLFMGAETYIRTVYKTMSPTFTGEIGGYSTQGEESPQQTEQPATTNNEPATQTPAAATAQDPEPTTSDALDSITSVEATSLGSTLAVADPTSSLATHETKVSSSSSLPAPTSSAAASTATPSSSSSADQGTSPGAKAGIAFGVVGGLLLVSLIVFMIFKRRKRLVQQRLSRDNEKLNNGGDNLARMPSRSDPRAPRISLRPVTQFLPNWNLDKNAPRAAANLAPATANQWDRPGTSQNEMELNAGDLVRLLHEYDDGWALCIRLDRSQQGVVPRTCLSTRPVKPRPPQGAARPGPPINPQGGFPRGPNPLGRPMTPQGRPMTPQGRPMTPQGQRPPQGMGPRPAGPMSPGPRPQSPGPRPQSPGPRQQGPPGARPQSPNGMSPRPMGAGSSPMNPAPSSPNRAPQRKPVPGQAY